MAGATWHPLMRIAVGEPAWRIFETDLRREELAYTNTMRLRFVASDHGQQTLVAGARPVSWRTGDPRTAARRPGECSPG